MMPFRIRGVAPAATPDDPDSPHEHLTGSAIYDIVQNAWRFGWVPFRMESVSPLQFSEYLRRSTRERLESKE